MRNVLLASAAALALTACGQETGTAAPEPIAPQEVAPESAAPEAMTIDEAAPPARDVAELGAAELGDWGVDLTAMDTAVDPGADFFRYVNGAWLDSFEIPADKTRYGAFDALRDRSEAQVRAIIEEAAASDAAPGSNMQKIGDWYTAFLDLEAIEAAGLDALTPEMGAIAAAADHDALALVLNAPGFAANDIWSGSVSVDAKNPDRYAFGVGHAGLGLPDRSFYLSDEARLVDVRAAYRDHIAAMLTLAGQEAADAKADAILAFETQIATAHWERAQRRNRDLTYNAMTLDELAAYAPGYPWARAFAASGLPETDYVVVREKDAFPALAAAWAETDLDTLKAYAVFHTLTANADYLPQAFDEADFAFFGQALNGQPEQRARWKRGVESVNANLGFAVGEIYVERHFPLIAKEKMDELVANLRAALGARLETLEWMGEETRAAAAEKLAKFTPKIGYPEKWRDYSTLEVGSDDLMGNVRRSRAFAVADNYSHLGQPIDKTEWFMTPQTVNAYYSPTRNEIVFPAAILQAPFFDPYADDAVNYGGIGGVIGHEIGHGFDDQGSKSDGDGRLRNWWTDEDRAAFEERTSALVAQYSAYEPVPGHAVNGALTLGENIGDLGGVSMALEAYRMSLGGQEAPVLDGFTGEQRLFMGWAQVWRGKYRDEAMINRLKTAPHSPPQFRTNGVVRNMPGWYAAFDVQEGDALYLAPDRRVGIW